MPTNPNIILSGNQMAAPQLPDVNAMMQTRTAGLENIYNIEQQRAAQAQAAQKEQEAALVEALAPAYATAFKGGGSREAITAAYDLLPPEIQPSVKGQIDKLLAMPSDDLRLSALEASMAGSEAGRTLLNRIPTEIQRMNAEIQRGQLDLSRAELEQRRAEAGMPKPMSAAEQAQIDLAERKFKAEQEKAAREAEMPEGITPKTKAKLDESYPKASRALQSAVTGFDQDIADLKTLIEDPGLKDISGLYGSKTPNISSAARRAQSLFDKIKAGAGLSALIDLKSASPAGGALGNVSNQEGQKLENSVAAFAQEQDYEDLRRALRNYLVDLKMSRENILSAFDETYRYRADASSENVAKESTARRQRLEAETPLPGKTSLPAGVTVKRNN